jgi:decaprenylphospho-beta-D-erythro-pentofuranosid-2-ulose 2-reductase
MRRVLILGGTSAIAEATAREFAKRGDALFLVGRSGERLKAIADDLKIRGATIAESTVADLRDVSTHEPLIRQATDSLGGLDTVLIAYGTLSDQSACELSVDLMLQELQTNAISVMSLCTLLATEFEAQGRGVIGVISSVAGDRGRKSNYVYGAAKAAVSAFTSGLRQRLYRKGVFVVTIKPGFVDTPMTASFKKGALWASADTVGKQIAKALIRGTPVLYTPGFWRLIMFIIRSIPEFMFRRLAL